MSFKIRSHTTASSFSEGNNANAVSIRGFDVNSNLGNVPNGYVLTWNGNEWITAPGGGGVVTGPTGADGKSVLNGIINPTTEGDDGDFYINTTTNEIFGPKFAGVWGSGTSLIGPTGPTGTNGNTQTYIGPTGVVQIYESTGVLTGSSEFKVINNQVLIPSGTVSLPSLAFTDETDTGLYLSSGNIGLSVNGSNSVEIKNNGVFQNGSGLNQTYGVNRNPLNNGTGANLIVSAGSAGTGPNIHGGNLLLRSGVSSGTGYSSIQLQTHSNGSSANTEGSVVTRKLIAGPIQLPLSAGTSTVDLLSFNLTPSNYFSAICDVNIFATDGTGISNIVSINRISGIMGTGGFTQTNPKQASTTSSGTINMTNFDIEILPNNATTNKTLQFTNTVDIPLTKYYFYIEINYTSSVEVTLLI